jgi:micrococcal nuclease
VAAASAQEPSSSASEVTASRRALGLLASFSIALTGCGLLSSETSRSSEPTHDSRAESAIESTGQSDASQQQGQPIESNAVVVFVIDGDTVQFDIDGIEESVRFIGIDTPEKTGGFRDAECFGDEASARMRELLEPGDAVFLELDVEARDRFDRLLAYVFISNDGSFLNMTMVEEGLAAAFPFPPNTLYADDFEAAERVARDLNLGLWSACGSPDVLLQPGG